MLSITYTKQGDGTFLKEGSFQAVPAEVRIACGGQPATGSKYTLARATEIIEEAIAKGQVKHDKYSIVAAEEAVEAAVIKASKVKKPKAPKDPNAPVDPNAPAPVKVDRKTKYDTAQFVTLYTEGKSIEEVIKATGASYAFVRWQLKKANVLRPAVRVKRTAIESPVPAAA